MKNMRKTGSSPFVQYGKTGLLLILTMLLCLGSFGIRSELAQAAFTPKNISDQAVNVAGNASSQKSSKSVSGKFRVAYSQSALDLLSQVIRQKGKGSNILISPDSILTALTMTELGASGKTRREMVKGLGQGIGPVAFSQYLAGFHKRVVKKGDPEKKAIYQNANSLWFRKSAVTLRQKYLNKLAKYYNADVYEAPFDSQTVSDINNWVYNGTRGMISKILERLSKGQDMVLVNAVAFEGQWWEPMRPVSRSSFRTSKGKKSGAAMVGGSADRYLQIKGGEGILKYYKGSDFAFMALLPPKGTTPEKYIRNLTGRDLVKGLKKAKDRSMGISISLVTPEFGFSSGMSLKKTLRRMGIKTAFSGKADFSLMCEEPMQIDDVLHKAVIELDRKGTKAAAVTAVIMKASSMPMKHIQVVLDRPFVFGIVDVKTGLPVFLGILNKP